ncbi:MAG: hypothetical protein J1E98_01580 [Lachnospiraceae bacterium]|nr:hypothetical protein [Lachnospiraceae bacterium]
MAKKFGKFLMTTAALGALAAGAYYFFMKKDEFLDDDFDEDDDFDDFDEDLDDDVESEADRKYVDLDLSKTAEKIEEMAEDKEDDFREGLNAAKAEATDKIVGESNEPADSADNSETNVEEFFDDEDAEDEEYEINDSLDAM